MSPSCCPIKKMLMTIAVMMPMLLALSKRMNLYASFNMLFQLNNAFDLCIYTPAFTVLNADFDLTHPSVFALIGCFV